MRSVFACSMMAMIAGTAYAGDCPGDCNGDGSASVLDFVCFQGEWQNQTAAGDCNGDGQYSILDFVCFQGEWQDFAQNGCNGGDDPLNDNFDSYAAGSEICGQGGWTCWGNNQDVSGIVSDEFAFSEPNSLCIDGTQGLAGDDTVFTFDGITSGQWTLSTQTYVPSGQAGLTAYFIMLNTYTAPTGPYNWSTQVRFDPGLGIVESEFDGGIAVIMEDQWVELEVEIDLDNDTQTIIYGGQEIVTKSWVDGVSGGGVSEIKAIDLYGNEPGLGAVMYYDDISLTEGID